MYQLKGTDSVKLVGPPIPSLLFICVQYHSLFIPFFLLSLYVHEADLYSLGICVCFSFPLILIIATLKGCSLYIFGSLYIIGQYAPSL